MTVSTLAEDAAISIGANPLRAKVGGLFHDIGKLSMPQYFVENNRDSTSEHLKLNPQLSSIIIRDHVKEGLILARQYHLYRWISGAISTHHGDDLVRYFYNAAQKQRQESSDASPVIESQFRYTGRPPRAKELVIVSLADACEAATRSLAKPTAAKIEAMVEDIFLMRYQGGQLRNADLSLAELDKVKLSFIKTLLSIYHGRIAYSPEELNAEDILQVEKSQSSQAE
jgi:putative nucleotidyltransferase with HDIG domain